MNDKFFYYLLSEARRDLQKPSQNLFDQLREFIDSNDGKEAFNKFCKTKLPDYADVPVKGYYDQPKRFF